VEEGTDIGLRGGREGKDVLVGRVSHCFGRHLGMVLVMVVGIVMGVM
jgi:hypothetical protein